MTDELHCACVIHGNSYDWRYVDNLYAMLRRNLSVPVHMHVFTEAHRGVPPYMTKHVLQEWPEISGTKRAWWYKMQLFDPRHGLGRLLYLDLDVVICDSLDWLFALDPGFFWTINDWKHLWKGHWQGMNSSMMYWDHAQHPDPWQRFREHDRAEIFRGYRGDQDFLTQAVPRDRVRFFSDDLIRSWRWQVWDGGMDPRTRRYSQPGAGALLPHGTSVVVFHGQPKPHQVDDAFVKRCWHDSIM